MTSSTIRAGLVCLVCALGFGPVGWVSAQEPAPAAPLVWVDCPACGGTGKTLTPCANRKCVGGKVTYEGLGKKGDVDIRPCPVCHGKGTVETPCKACGGRGQMQQRAPAENAPTPTRPNPQNHPLATPPADEPEWVVPEGLDPADDLAPDVRAQPDAPPPAQSATTGTDGTPSGNLPAKPPDGLPADIDRRPQPAGLAFETALPQLKTYLDAQYDDVRAVEAERIRRLAGTRRYLVNCMRHVPYDVVTDIRLNNGQTVRGTVPNCTDEHIVVRRDGGGRRGYKVRWAQLAPAQYIAFLDFYAHKRIDAGMPRDAGRDYLLAALIADWYGDAEGAAAWKQRAVKANPDLAGEAGVLLYYLAAE